MCGKFHSMSQYHKAYENARKKRFTERKQLPAGLRVQRSKQSSLNTPTYRLVKNAVLAVIAVASAAAVILFILSFVSGESAPKKPRYYKESGYQQVDVQIGFKPEKSKEQ